MPQCGESERSPWIYLCEDRSGGGIPYATELSFTEGPQGGFHFYRNGTPGPTAWYPASGSRYGFHAAITNSGSYGYWRSSTMSATQSARFLTIVPTTVFPYDSAISTASCASALSVRCIRE